MGKALHLVKTTGDLIKEPDRGATVPVPLPIVMVQVKGPFTALDRKIWALCLHLGWEELETKSKVGEWHEIQEIELRRLIQKFSGTKGMNWIWESAQRLTETTVRYSRVDANDKRWKGVTSLFTAEMPEEEEKDGVFRYMFPYMFPSPLVPIFREPGRFARLRVQFLLGLKSKYAVTLYELFEGVANKRIPTIEATVGCEGLFAPIKEPDPNLISKHRISNQNKKTANSPKNKPMVLTSYKYMPDKYHYRAY
jgi:hypothetical protein